VVGHATWVFGDGCGEPFVVVAILVAMCVYAISVFELIVDSCKLSTSRLGWLLELIFQF
jgi:hypothetical protein